MTYLFIYIWGVLVVSLYIANEEVPDSLKDWVGAATAALLWPIVIPAALLQKVLE